MFHILFQKFNSFYERIFEKWGEFLAKYHVYVIIASISFNIFLSLFIFRLELITDTDVLFMPTDSQARIDEQQIKSIFNSTYYLENSYYMHQVLDLGTYAEINFQTCAKNPQFNTPDNILQEKYIKEINMVNDYVLKNTFVTLNNTKFSYADVCAKRNGKCLIDGEDLLSKEFYKDWLYDSMLKKTRMLKEQEDLRVDSAEIENDSKPIQNEFRMYIKMGGGLTELTYNLGKYIRLMKNS